MKKKIIIYGGAFNPPTIAHKTILQGLVNYAKNNYNEIWLMPSGERPDKTIKVDQFLREKMCKCLIKDIAYPTGLVKLKTSELYANKLTNTYETALRLNNKHPEIHFTWVFGADSVKTMHTWPGGKNLVKELDMLLVPRSGTNLHKLPPKAKLLDIKTKNISSTDVRKAIINKEIADHLMPNGVLEIIRDVY